MTISTDSNTVDPSLERARIAALPPPDVGSTAFPKPFAVVAVVAALYFGRDILMPLAVAVLLTFALAPLVSLLRKIHIPRPPAVVFVVLSAFAAIVLFGMIVAGQLGTLAENLPQYQSNIETKVKAIRSANLGEGIFDRVSRLLERLGREIESDPPAAPSDGTVVPQQPPAAQPMPVEVVEPKARPLQVVQTIIGPLVEPLAMGGIIIVVVIFMLMKREDLRDRFIRLVGAGDLHRTTEALQDAGKRVGRYLLMQLIVNVTYAVPVGVGLWSIGVPNAPLWGLMALVLRFVPYIGPIIASIFPLALALAVDPGWTMVLWTAALFVVLELASNNIVEPWLYGSRTGLSPLAIIVAAIFWTWLWGPLGLLLSTPLTVCLVVLGRHVPQFEFLDVLFGNEPVLEPHQQLYQRLLAGDPHEATDRAEKFLEDKPLAAFYANVAIPALALGELDRARGVMGDERRSRVADSALALVDNLEDYAEEEAQDDDEDGEATDVAESDIADLPEGEGKVVLCAGGRGELDDAAAAMLAQVLTAQGSPTRLLRHDALAAGRLAALDLGGVHSVAIGFLNAESQTHARYVVRRLKRSRGSLRVGVVFWTGSADVAQDAKKRAAIGCDFIAYSMAEAVGGALSDEPAVRPSPSARASIKRKPKKVQAKEAA